MRALGTIFVLLSFLLLLGCATATAPEPIPEPAPKSSVSEKNLPTPLSVCVDNCTKRHSECHARGVFTPDTCDAHYQQCVSICYRNYN
ncbi:MAG: hypothetical protein KJO81_11830 [Gammaproteobacteria bacterium]|nr:hypothetical protein [Gammaproteobacteria bacterium]